MKEEQHTPGPWVAHKEMIEQFSGDPYPVFSVGYADECKVDYSNSDPFQEICGDIMEEANARLIASAPDLLAALKVSLNMIDQLLKAAEAGIVPDVSIGFFKNRTEILEPAIRKAEGK